MNSDSRIIIAIAEPVADHLDLSHLPGRPKLVYRDANIEGILALLRMHKSYFWFVLDVNVNDPTLALFEQTVLPLDREKIRGGKMEFFADDIVLEITSENGVLCARIGVEKKNAKFLHLEVVFEELPMG